MREALRATVEATSDNTGMTVMLAVSYGGREEIARAARAHRAARASAASSTPSAITTDAVATHLGTTGIPDPDLLIRTSGEMRISNFFLWQLAYTEIYVTRDAVAGLPRARVPPGARRSSSSASGASAATPAQVERERLRVAY